MSTAHGITPPVADSGELADPEPAVAGVELLGVEPPGVAPPGVEPPGVAPPGVESDGVGVGPVGVGVGSLGFGVGVDPGALSRRRARTAAASTPCSATRPPTRSVTARPASVAIASRVGRPGRAAASSRASTSGAIAATSISSASVSRRSRRVSQAVRRSSSSPDPSAAGALAALPAPAPGPVAAGAEATVSASGDPCAKRRISGRRPGRDPAQREQPIGVVFGQRRHGRLAEYDVESVLAPRRIGAVAAGQHDARR